MVPLSKYRMNKKTLLQFALFFVFSLITFLFLKIYFFNNTNDIDVVIKESKDKKFLNVEKSNIIHNLEYFYQDNIGNSYIINSNSGKINIDSPEVVTMKNVKATLSFKNSSPIIIISNNATYNSITHETKFYENTIVTYMNNTIKSENMDLFFNKNSASIYENVIYKNLNSQLQADKVELDLLTKNFKIYMKNKSEKIKMINLN